ncbi:hypothetical protein ABKW28_12885 [Nocardioides sp. 31GB23]|uniref:hypothetical protein n=1 Tax=Nocardioides sp. 31GB23 TaxID=3156065 RepID=UPI0032AF78C5
MKATITVTQTIDIDLDTFHPTVAVDIEAEEGLPHSLVMAAVKNGCKATIKSIEEQQR